MILQAPNRNKQRHNKKRRREQKLFPPLMAAFQRSATEMEKHKTLPVALVAGAYGCHNYDQAHMERHEFLRI